LFNESDYGGREISRRTAAATGTKRENNQKAAVAQDELDPPSPSGSEEESEKKKKRKELARSVSKGKGWMAGEVSTRHCIPETFLTGKSDLRTPKTRSR
jgi:hypothetical protein